MTSRSGIKPMGLFVSTLTVSSLACAPTRVNSNRILDDGSNPVRPRLVLIQDFDVGAVIAKAISEQWAVDIQNLGLAAE